MVLFKHFVILATLDNLCSSNLLDKFPMLNKPPRTIWLVQSVQNITLPCSTKIYDPTVSYSWEKDGENLNVTTNPNIITNTKDGSIILLKPSEDDVGRYQCFAKWDHRVTSSEIINVKRTFLITRNNCTQKHKGMEGEPLRLVCPVEATPPAIYQWKRSPIHATAFEDVKQSHIVMYDGTLWLFNLTRKEAGVYRYVCVVTSSVTMVTEVAAEHYIEEVEGMTLVPGRLKEVFTSGDEVAVEGDVITLSCIYTGSPTPGTIWLKNGQRLGNSRRMTIHKESHGQVLTIRDIRSTDQGTYNCIVSNKVTPPRSHHMELSVAVPPTVQNEMSKVTVAAGDIITLDFNVRAEPEPIVRWTYDGQYKKMPNISLTTLFVPEEPVQGHITVRNATQDHTGYYGFRAYNHYGDAYTETLLYVI